MAEKIIAGALQEGDTAHIDFKKETFVISGKKDQKIPYRSRAKKVEVVEA